MRMIKDIVPGVLANLRTPEKNLKQELIAQWPKIAGPQIAPHTKPSLGKEGKLFVWVNQSTLACELNHHYKEALLNRAQAQCGKEHIRSIVFRVGQLR